MDESLTLSNGMTLDLYLAFKNLRIYAVVTFAVALFFLSWCIFSIIFMAEPILAFYGIICFTCQILVSTCMMMMQRVAYSRKCAKCNLILICIFCSLYFVLHGLSIYFTNAPFEDLAVAVIFSFFWVQCACTGHSLLSKVQYLVHKRILDRGLILQGNCVLSSENVSDDECYIESKDEENEEIALKNSEEGEFYLDRSISDAYVFQDGSHCAEIVSKDEKPTSQSNLDSDLPTEMLSVDEFAEDLQPENDFENSHQHVRSTSREINANIIDIINEEDQDFEAFEQCHPNMSRLSPNQQINHDQNYPPQDLLDEDWHHQRAVAGDNDEIGSIVEDCTSLHSNSQKSNDFNPYHNPYYDSYDDIQSTNNDTIFTNSNEKYDEILRIIEEESGAKNSQNFIDEEKDENDSYIEFPSYGIQNAYQKYDDTDVINDDDDMPSYDKSINTENDVHSKNIHSRFGEQEKPYHSYDYCEDDSDDLEVEILDEKKENEVRVNKEEIDDDEISERASSHFNLFTTDDTSLMNNSKSFFNKIDLF